MPTLTTRKKEHQKKSFTPEWLRSFKGFENYSDTKAQHEIEQLKELAVIICRELQNTS